ncbi:MAG TPA: fumarylacetoacetate hydrolase family protein [Acetobacteraceae bacterium]|nr:fumarylacetoacetate hydrolase family protein [Acetobacteraceae bacterium]
MSEFDAVGAAAALHANRLAGHPAGPLPPGLAPQTAGEAAAVQRALAELRRDLPIGGFKIGATGRRMQAFLGIDHPCAGYMAAADIHAAPAELPFAAFRAPQIECELAVRLARDLPPGSCTPAQAEAAVGELFAAIEIVENRYGPPPIGDVAAVGLPTLIADQFYHAAAVIGAAPADWRALDLGAIEGRAAIDGTVRNAGKGAELLGHPLRGLAWLASSPVVAAFGGLRAGHVVLLGSVTPPVALDGPCTVSVAFDGLPEARLRFL